MKKGFRVGLILIAFLVVAGIGYLAAGFGFRRPGHFYPGRDSVMKFEFDYPWEWGVLEEFNRVETLFSGKEEMGGAIVVYDPGEFQSDCFKLALPFENTCIDRTHDLYDERDYFSIVLFDVFDTSRARENIPQFASNYFSAPDIIIILDQYFELDGYLGRKVVIDLSNVSPFFFFESPDYVYWDITFLNIQSHLYKLTYRSLHPDPLGDEFYSDFNRLIGSLHIVP